MAQIRYFTSAIPAGANQAVAHGLVRAPDIVGLLHGTAANMSVGTTTPTATNLYITNGGAPGATAHILAVASHSVADGTNQMRKLVASIPMATANHPVAHGLVRIPTVIFLLFQCGVNISLGATAADATNIYITNANMAGAEDCHVFVMAPHSIIM